MIKAQFYVAQDGHLLGFEINGHSGYAEQGEDIVCASVSSCAYMTANTILEILKVSAFTDVSDGRMVVRIPFKNADQCRDILSGFKLHMVSLEEQYPEFINVNYLEV